MEGKGMEGIWEELERLGVQSLSQSNGAFESAQSNEESLCCILYIVYCILLLLLMLMSMFRSSPIHYIVVRKVIHFHWALLQAASSSVSFYKEECLSEAQKRNETDKLSLV